MKKKITFLTICTLLNFALNLRAQNIGVNNPAPDASALWDMVSTDKGILIPRMTSAQRNGIASPANGLLVYDNTLGKFYFFNGTIWLPIGGNLGWSLTGDAGTSPATNFLGTTDSQSLLIKVNNVQAGFLDDNDGVFLGRNTFLGKSAGFSNTVTGYDNTFIGTKAGYSNTTGTLNTAVGAKALQTSTTAFSNVAIGREAMQLSVTASQNTAVGTGALQNTTTGFWNNAFGYLAMRQTTSAGIGNNAFGNETLFNNTGQFNSAFGQTCMRQNTSGNYNSAFGSSALYNNTTGTNNVVMGDVTMVNNTTGSSNTAIGFRAAGTSTTAGRVVAVGDSTLYFNLASDNVAVGSRAMKSNTSGTNNTAMGFESMYRNSNGNYNNAFGNNSMSANTTGLHNVAVGYYTLTANIAGSQNTALGNYAADKHPSYNNCTFIGYQADANASGYTNSAAIGYSAQVTASNQVKIGNGTVTAIGGAVNWSIISDGRFKKNIQENIPGLDFINALKPVTYNYDIKSYNKHIFPVDDSLNNDENAIKQKEEIVYSGFIAQEVEDVANKLGYNFSGVHHPENDKDTYTLSYAEFVVPLVKAIQELSKQNTELRMMNAELKETLTGINNRLTKNKID
ncbi:MAG: tail fiber domain-containing protein [Bacteroidia bacterium]